MQMPDVPRDAAHPGLPEGDPEPELVDAGAWSEGRGRIVRQVQTDEQFVLLPLPQADRDPGVWDETIERLADVDSPVLLPPRARVARGAGLLFEPLPEVSFAQHLRDGGASDQVETLVMVADLARALEVLHGAGIVLRRLSYQEILRTDDGWALLLGSGADPAIPGPGQRRRLQHADVVLLCAAAATVLTGRRPVPGRARPPLSVTNPALPASAAAVLDAVLDAALDPALDHGDATERADPAGATDRGALTAGELAGILHGVLEEPEEPEVPAGTAVTDDDPTDELAPLERVPGATPSSAADGAAVAGLSPAQQRLAGLAQRIATRRAAGDDDQRARPRPRSAPLPMARHSRPGARARTRGGRPRAVLAGAAALVLGAGLVATWALSGPRPEVAPLVQGASPGAEDPEAPGEPHPVETGSPTAASETPEQIEPERNGGAQDERAAGGAAGSSTEATETLPDLVRVRGEALRSRDTELLATVYVPGASDLQDDQATVAALADGAAFADLSMEIVELSVLPPLAGERPAEEGPGRQPTPVATGADSTGEKEGAEGAESVRIAGTVKASGTGLSGGGAEYATTSQEVIVELERSPDRGWLIVDVTPE